MLEKPALCSPPHEAKFGPKLQQAQEKDLIGFDDGGER